jgi:hypothetical protein
VAAGTRIVAVVVSLECVGLQMGQAHDMALSNTYQARSDRTVAQSMATTGSPELLNGLSNKDSGRNHQLTLMDTIALGITQALP